MTVFTKLASAATLAAAFTLPLAAPAYAGEDSDDIVVRSNAAMQQWQAETTADINRALARDPMSRKVRPNNAIVEVAFTLGANGEAENIRVLDGTGNWSARRAAKIAVRSLDTLDEVPVSNPAEQKFLAQIVFADDKQTHTKLMAKLNQSRSERLASADNDYILLGS